MACESFKLQAPSQEARRLEALFPSPYLSWAGMRQGLALANGSMKPRTKTTALAAASKVMMLRNDNMLQTIYNGDLLEDAKMCSK